MKRILFATDDVFKNVLGIMDWILYWTMYWILLAAPISCHVPCEVINVLVIQEGSE